MFDILLNFRRNPSRQGAAGIDAPRLGQETVVLGRFVLKARVVPGEITAAVDNRSGKAAVACHPARREPVVGELQAPRLVEQCQKASWGGGVDDVVPAVAALLLGRKPQPGGVAASGRNQGVVLQVKRSLAIDVLRAAVPSIINYLAVAGPVRLDKDVAVDKVRAIARVGGELHAVLGIHQVELPVAALDPGFWSSWKGQSAR